MQNLQSFSQPYSDEFEANQQYEEDIDDNIKAEVIKQEQIKTNIKSSGQTPNYSDMKIKIPLQGKQTQQTTSPITIQNPVNANILNNRFLVPKRPRQSIGSQNIDRKQFLQKITVNSQTAMRPQDHQKLPNLGEGVSINEQNGFKRSRVGNHRRSLHIVMSDKQIEDSKNPKQYLFVKNKKKSITSHVNSARRYADEEGGKDNIVVDISMNQTNQLERDAIIRRTREKLHFMSSRILNSPKSRSHNKSLNQITVKDEVIYKEPQINSQRVVVFIKTYILSPFQSISLEISVLNGSIIIVGKLLGQEIDTLRLVLNQERSSKILAESFNDWQIVGKRVFVQANQSGVKKLKIAPLKSVISTIIKQDQSKDLNESPSISLSNKTRHKNLLFIKQTQFLQRNYYSLMNKNDQTLNTKQQTVSNSINPSSQNTINHNQNNSVQKTENKRQKSPSIDLKQHLAKHNKHLNYLSPEIKEKAQEYKKAKQKSLTKQAIQKQIQEKQVLAKRQQQQIQRLSKPKQTIKSQSNQNLNIKAKAKEDRSMSKQKKFNFRAVNKKIPQKQAQIINSVDLKDAQSRINIKMTHFQQQKTNKNYRTSSQMSDSNKQSLKPSKSKASTTKKSDIPQWKEINLQKTDSIDHIKIENSNSEDNYSEFQSQVSRHNQELPTKIKQKQSKRSKAISKASQDEYEEDDFQSQVVEAQNVQKNKMQDFNKKLSEKEMNYAKQQKVSQTAVVPASSNKQDIQKQKSKPSQLIEDQQDQQPLIRDVDQEQYDESFDQFKQDKPTQNKQKMAKNPSRTNMKKKSQPYDQSFQNQRYVEEVSNSIKDQPLDINQQNEYKDDYEEQNYQEEDYENIIQENGILDDHQIINKIQEDDNYLDQDFDL